MDDDDLGGAIDPTDGAGIDVTSFEGGGEGGGSFGYDTSADAGTDSGAGPGGAAADAFGGTGAASPGMGGAISLANVATQLMKDMGILQPGVSQKDFLNLIQQITLPNAAQHFPDLFPGFNPVNLSLVPALQATLSQFADRAGAPLYDPNIFNPDPFAPLVIDPATGLPVSVPVGPGAKELGGYGLLNYDPLQNTVSTTPVERGPDLSNLTPTTVAGLPTGTPGGPTGTPGGPTGTPGGPTGTPGGPTGTETTTTGTPTGTETTGPIDFSTTDTSGSAFDKQYRDLLQRLGMLPGGVTPPVTDFDPTFEQTAGAQPTSPVDQNTALRNLVAAAGGSGSIIPGDFLGTPGQTPQSMIGGNFLG